MKNPFELNNREVIEVYKSDMDMLIEYASYELYNAFFINKNIEDAIGALGVRPNTYDSTDQRTIIAACTDIPAIVQMYPTLNLNIALDLIARHAAEFVDKAVKAYNKPLDDEE